MMDRRRAEQKLAEVAREWPELAAREMLAAYAAFANCQEEYAPGAREYASAMLAAWVRSHLSGYPKTRTALEGPNWASELVAATLLAWQDLGPDSPIKR